MGNIIGHKKIIEQLSQIVRSGNIGHAYIFEGRDGIGKFLVAQKFASEILKVDDVELNLAEYKSIEPEDGMIKISRIRELGEDVMLKPTISDRKVFIIRDGDLMNESAQNALLKVLEEPPEYISIIITTSNKEKIIRTIKSRCTAFSFAPLTDSEIKNYYNDIDDNVLKFARGSIGKATELRNSKYLEQVLEIYQSLKTKDLLSLNKTFTKIKEYKDNIQDILELIMLKYYDEMSENYTIKIKQIEIIEECRENLKKNANFDIALDDMMIKLWQV